jgi:hypothetical protein
LSEVLPFRRGQKGLHLIEAVAQAAPKPDPAAHIELATMWFRGEVAAIEMDIMAGGSLERRFVALNDPALEQKAAALLRPHLRILAKPAEKKKSGLFRWFGR